MTILKKKNKLKISLVQSNLFVDKHENFKNFEKLFLKIDTTDVILLPEMFNTSFVPERVDYAEIMSGETIFWMKKIAKKYNCSISGTLMISENKKIYNRLVWITKKLEIFTYDKRHLFSLVNEDKLLNRGNKRLVIEQDGWKICPLICYDLRFPVFSRNNVNYDILIYLANWPKKRIDAWNTLLKARSIENQCITIGVNRVGQDKKGVLYNGMSKVYDALGNRLLSCGKNKEEVYTVVLDKQTVNDQKSKLNFLKDIDNFTVH